MIIYEFLNDVKNQFERDKFYYGRAINILDNAQRTNVDACWQRRFNRIAQEKLEKSRLDFTRRKTPSNPLFRSHVDRGLWIVPILLQPVIILLFSSSLSTPPHFLLTLTFSLV